MKAILIAAVLLTGSQLSAKTPPEMKTAKVIAQSIGSSDRGTAFMPLGNAVVGVPLGRSSNVIAVDTDKARVTLTELGNKGFIVLPVNGTVKYYVDRGAMVITDSKGKKHKFGPIHIEELPQEK